MKVCDIADWFKYDLTPVIVNDLHELPRFHRKQWEFAMKFSTLRDLGVLRPDAVGISFGAGKESLAYALAPHVQRLWVTDLYNEDTDWVDARTDDLDAFIRANALFPTALDRLSAKNMDMRAIAFPDDTFDFAYSSSAVEHIGDWNDFRTHLNEVRRVLKPGGVYVMTTDIIYGPQWEIRGNYKFTPEGLAWWLKESGMAHDAVVDCRIAHHRSNTPMPPLATSILMPDGGPARNDILREFSQVQMLMGRTPHSSVLLTMRKAPVETTDAAFPGYEETKDFLLEARSFWEDIIAESRLAPSTTPLVPVAQQFRRWATAYLLLGSALRVVVVRIQTMDAGEVTIGVNKSHSSNPRENSVYIKERTERTNGDLEVTFAINSESEWSYSIHGRALEGVPIFNVSVTVHEPDHAPLEPVMVRRIWRSTQVPTVERLNVKEKAAIPEVPEAPVVPEVVVAPPAVQKGTGLIRLANKILHPTGLRLDR
jgi:SAM-dependent methyltransferase